MKSETYNDIVIEIQNYRGLTKDCAKMLIIKYPSLSKYTLYSILSQITQQKMMAMHRKTFGKDKTYYYQIYLEAVQRGEPAGILLRLANQLNTCPALLARKVLQTASNMDDDYCKKVLGKLMRDTNLIEDKNLAYEIYMCTLYDDQYGPIANAMSDSIGEEYEVKLEIFLNERNIAYHNEEYLREKGYDKTPDCKLEIPIAVNGVVINWIESKAQFGSPMVHQKYTTEQYLSYWNRFGPGLVIYWFGFVDNIIQTNESRFIIMDSFPENITYMDPNSLR